LTGFAAVNTGNNLLFLIVSALLGFMAATGLVGWYNIRGLSVQADLPDEIYSGAATLVTVRLKNRKKLFPSFLIRSTLLGNSVTTHILSGEGIERNSFVHTFSGRGLHSILSALISSPFPVNFFVRRLKIPLFREVTVFPSPHLTSGNYSETGRERKGEASAATKGIDGEVSNISDYTGNEPMKLIHWRLSAKFDDLKVKEMNGAAGEPVIIEITKLPGRDLEERLSMACHLINRLMGASHPVGLKLREKVIRPELSRKHRLNLLTELALYDKD
jgi:uncharacterized protein (DUF58 family)